MGDECSPIDIDSFLKMPVKAQERAAESIRKAKKLYGLEELPQKIAFGSAEGANGLYSETYRTLTLSSKYCKDPNDACSTMVHELTHYYDHASGYVAEKVYKQALKELGLKSTDKEVEELAQWMVGYSDEDDVKDVHEFLTFRVEKAAQGKENELANKCLR